MQKFFGQLFARNQAKKRSLGIGVGKYHARTNFAAVFQHHPDSSSVAHVDLSHRRRSSNFYSELFAGLRQCLRDRAHASHDVPVKSLQLVLSAAKEMKQ